MPSIPGTVNFPTSLDDDISLIEAANNASTTLSSAISDSDTTLTVSSTTPFSSTGALSIEGEILFLYRNDFNHVYRVCAGPE